jgi:hypothetical protein
MKVETEGEARLALHAFLKHAAKNFKKAVEVDDDRVVAATLVDFLTKIHPYYEVSLLLVGYELPKNESEVKENDE